MKSVSVVKYGRSAARGGARASPPPPLSVSSSHQTVSDNTLRHGQWFPNTQQSRFLTACRRLEKLVFLPSIFDARLSSLMTWNLQSCPTTVLNEIMWHFFGGGQNIPWPSCIFSGVKIRQPQDLCPWMRPFQIRTVQFWQRTAFLTPRTTYKSDRGIWIRVLRVKFGHRNHWSNSAPCMDHMFKTRRSATAKTVA